MKDENIQHKMFVRDYFDKDHRYWSELYNERNKNDRLVNYIMRRRKLYVFKMIDQHFYSASNFKVLDVGCGAGVYLTDLTKRGFNVFGTDISVKMIKNYVQNSRHNHSIDAKLSIADAEMLPFKDNFFDLILAIGLLEYLPNEQYALNEFKRILKPGGILIFSLPNLFKLSYFLDPYYYLKRLYKYMISKNPKMKTNRKINADDFAYNNNFTNKRYLKKDAYRLIERTSLMGREVVGIGYGPFTFWQKQYVPIQIGIILSDFIENFSRLKPFNFIDKSASRWIVCSQKTGRLNQR